MTINDDARSFEKARNETLSYHKLYYGRHKLFDENSWLAKPDAGLMEILQKNLIPAYCQHRRPLTILDLGCGVGRNAIPMAMALAKANIPAIVTGVDVLPESIDILNQNSISYQVEQIIDGVVADNDHYVIEPGRYDLIAAISVIEHCAGRVKASKILKAIARGLKANGLVRIEMTSDRNVIDMGTKQAIPTHVETPLTERQVRAMLDEAFAGFKMLSMEVFPFMEVLDKDDKKILWQSRQVSFSAQCAEGTGQT